MCRDWEKEKREDGKREGNKMTKREERERRLRKVG
jgi:hypothetical protein